MNIYKICAKYHVMAIKQHLGKNALHLQSIQEKFLPIIFSHDFDQLSIYDVKVDWVSADYNGYYICRATTVLGRPE